MSRGRSLLERRDLWMVSTMFFDRLYPRIRTSKANVADDAFTVDQIEGYLADRFL